MSVYRVQRVMMKILICLLIIVSNTASAEVFKCKDHGKTVYSGEPCSSDAQNISERMARPNLSSGIHPPDEPESSSMTLSLDGNGTYMVTGTVKDVPVTYQVDTGASMISVSKRIMDRAGIFSCIRFINVSTANGSIRTCVGIIPEITFGVFHMSNVEVSIVPNMAPDALLGMGALRHLNIHQNDGKMIISN